MDPGLEDDWLVRGGLMNPQALYDSIVECLMVKGYYGFSAWGLPGDTLARAASRIRSPYSVIRYAHRSRLTAFEIRTRQDGHNAVILPAEPTLQRCVELAALFTGPIPRP